MYTTRKVRVEARDDLLRFRPLSTSTPVIDITVRNTQNENKPLANQTTKHKKINIRSMLYLLCRKIPCRVAVTLNFGLIDFFFTWTVFGRCRKLLSTVLHRRAEWMWQNQKERCRNTTEKHAAACVYVRKATESAQPVCNSVPPPYTSWTTLFWDMASQQKRKRERALSLLYKEREKGIGEARALLYGWHWRRRRCRCC